MTPTSRSEIGSDSLVRRVQFTWNNRTESRGTGRPRVKLLGIKTRESGLLWAGKVWMTENTLVRKSKVTNRVPNIAQRERVAHDKTNLRVLGGQSSTAINEEIQFLSGDVVFDNDPTEQGNELQFLSGDVIYDDEINTHDTGKQQVIAPVEHSDNYDTPQRGNSVLSTQNTKSNPRQDNSNISSSPSTTSRPVPTSSTTVANRTTDMVMDYGADEKSLNLMERAEVNFAKVTTGIIDNTARVMQAFTDAWAAHLATCNGADGGHSTATTPSSQTWVKAHDATSVRVKKIMEDDRVKVALAKGDTAQVESIIQKEALKVYEEIMDIDTTKLRNMSDELFSVSNPAQAMVMLQGTLNHVGCACHSTVPGGGVGPMNMMSQFIPPIFLQRMQGYQKNEERHNHKHEVQFCGSCGWSGESCTNEKCPKCKQKKWISEEIFKEKFNRREHDD